jgi:hypothetical protein
MKGRKPGLIGAVTAAFLLFSAGVPAQETSWRPLGTSLSADPQGWAFHPTLAAAPDGTLYAAWSQHAKPANWELVGTYVKRWSSGGWQSLGGRVASSPGDPDGYSWIEGYAPALAVVGTTPYLAWYEGGGYGWGRVQETHFRSVVFVAHWDGAQWVLDRNPAMLNGALNTGPEAAARTPVLAVAGDMLHAAWIELRRIPVGAHNAVVVKRLVNGKWLPVGADLWAGSNPAQVLILDVALARVGDVLYVVWSQWPGGVHVARWDGTAWTRVGGALNAAPDGYAVNHVAMTGGKGTPYIAWQERSPSGNYQLYVKSWTGTAWVSLGASLNRDPVRGEAGRPALSHDGARLWLGWTEGGPGERAALYVRVFSNGAWSGPSRPLNAAPGTAADGPALAVRNGRPVVIWAEKNPPPATKQIYVKELP